MFTDINYLLNENLYINLIPLVKLQKIELTQLNLLKQYETS